jgi:integrase
MEATAERAVLNVDGLQPVTFQTLRRTFASIRIAEGGDVVKLSREMGHSNPSITLNIYAKLWNRPRGKAKEGLLESILAAALDGKNLESWEAGLGEIVANGVAL